MSKNIILKVLLVDNEPDYRESLSIRIEKHLGYFPVLASSAEEALEKMKDEHFDVLITDTNMEKTNGIDLIKSTRSQFPKTRVFSLFSGLNGSSLTKTDIKAMGVAGVMSKFEVQEHLLPELRSLAVAKSLYHILASIFDRG
ncbi:MAG: response regulator transcription factor [Bdellovibrionales bacterium]